jgi:integrase
MAHAKLTQTLVEKTPPPARGRTTIWDTALPRFAFRITCKGHRSYLVQYRNRNGIERGVTLSAALSVDEARKQARIVLGEVAKGNDPSAEKKKEKESARNSVKSIADLYFKLEGKRMRTLQYRIAIFERYIFPKFGARPIHSIRRNEIVRMLDEIEAERGPFASEHALTALRAFCNWYAIRDETFSSPFVRGMSRLTKDHLKGRDRVLSDEEIRAVWRAAEETSLSNNTKLANAYGYLLRFILLTGSRRNEASDMTREELSADGSLWTVPKERYKTGVAHEVPLSRMAQELLKSVPVIGSAGYVFTHNGKQPISGFTEMKKALDKRIVPPIARYTHHDLRRTARTLMARAGVPFDIAERCIGHTQPELIRIYDQHPYIEEKRAAFEKLAALIGQIISPEPQRSAKVVAMTGKTRART